MFRPGFYQIMARLRPGYGQGLFRPCFCLGYAQVIVKPLTSLD